jgi:hypothetical protein
VANYLSYDNAMAAGLVQLNSDASVTLRTSTVPQQLPRDSIRMSTKKQYNGGLFLFDVAHAPTGVSPFPLLVLLDDDADSCSVRKLACNPLSEESSGKSVDLICELQAIWAVGPNWPAGGEVDIMEGVDS